MRASRQRRNRPTPARSVGLDRPGQVRAFNRATGAYHPGGSDPVGQCAARSSRAAGWCAGRAADRQGRPGAPAGVVRRRGGAPAGRCGGHFTNSSATSRTGIRAVGIELVGAYRPRDLSARRHDHGVTRPAAGILMSCDRTLRVDDFRGPFSTRTVPVSTTTLTRGPARRDIKAEKVRCRWTQSAILHETARPAKA